jgi:hypothetical protein
MFKTSRVFSLLCALLVSACVPDSSSPVEADEPAQAEAVSSALLSVNNVVLNRATYPDAVCNDGSMGVYKIRRNTESDKWLIWLDGGGSCSDPSSCATRANLNNRNNVSSLWFQFTGGSGIPAAGIFSTDQMDNPVFHDANWVYIHYCSSDMWSGAHAGIVNPSTFTSTTPLSDWHFQGRAIATAVIADLKATQGLDDATDVTFAGGSAGGAGVFALVDDVRAMLPTVAKYQGIVDGGTPPKYNFYTSIFPGPDPARPHAVRDHTIDGIAVWDGQGDLSCELAANPVNKEFCRIGGFLTKYGHISTPLLIINSLVDNVQLGLAFGVAEGNVGNPSVRPFFYYSNIEWDSYIDFYCDEFKSQLNGIGGDPVGNYKVFARFALNPHQSHISVLYDDRMDSTIGGTSMREFIEDWHANPSAQISRIGSCPL